MDKRQNLNLRHLCATRNLALIVQLCPQNLCESSNCALVSQIRIWHMTHSRIPCSQGEDIGWHFPTGNKSSFCLVVTNSPCWGPLFRSAPLSELVSSFTPKLRNPNLAQSFCNNESFLQQSLSFWIHWQWKGEDKYLKDGPHYFIKQSEYFNYP